MKLGHAVWIADVGKRADGRLRKEAGVSTGLCMPVRLGGGGGDVRVVVVMHADDELLAFAGGLRPYDRKSVDRVTEMAKAVESVWRGV